jgi:GYF domain 2
VHLHRQAAVETGDEQKEQRPMRDEWYVARRGQDGNKRYGPVPLQQLRELVDTGRVQSGDLVWREGMGEWQRADQCEALFPPAPPRREPRDDRRDSDYDRDRGPRGYGRDYDDRPYPRRRYPQQQSSGWVTPLVVAGVIVTFCFLTCGGLVGMGMLNSRSSSSSYQPYYPTPVSEPEDPPQWQDPNPWQPNPGWQDPPFVPDPNPPIFQPPDPPIFQPPDPPVFVPDPNPIFVPDPDPKP